MEILSLLTNLGATEEVSGIGALGIDVLAILAQAFTFLVLFFVIKKFALDGIVKTLEKRRKTIDDGVRLGVEMEAEKAALDEKVEEMLRKARVEADSIIAGGQKESADIIKAAEEAANRKAEAILKEAHGKIDEDIAAARKGLEQEMRALVAEATEVIIEEKLDAKKDESLIKRAFARVGEQSLMANPSRRELAEVVLYLSGKMSQKKLTDTLAAYLVANRRTGELDAIMREVSRQREAQDKVTEVTATSAHKLNDSARKAIKSLLGNNKLIINEVVDAEVLGGVRLETSEVQLDLTVRNRLNQLKAAAK